MDVYIGNKEVNAFERTHTLGTKKETYSNGCKHWEQRQKRIRAGADIENKERNAFINQSESSDMGAQNNVTPPMQ